jgi:hypothetical protein
MGYAQFLAWVATTGWRVLGKQKYLNKVWKEATKGGKVILQTHFPKLLNKAKDYYKGFKTADLKIAPKTKIAPKKLTPKTKIEDLQIGPHIDSRGRLWPKFVKPIPKGPAKIIPFPKKPPHLKADGGRIDKALPKRSRDI